MDVSGDIQTVSEHAKDILRMTRDSEMMQSYVRVGKPDDTESDKGGGGIGSGQDEFGVGGGGAGGDRDSDDDRDATGIGGGGVVGGVGARKSKGAAAAAANRRRGRRRRGGTGGPGTGGGVMGAGGSSGGPVVTTTFNELTEEFRTRKTGTSGGGGAAGLGAGWSRRHKRDSRSRLLEEVYTDKDRAAAVNLGTRDIKASLRMKRRQDRDRTLHIPSTAESPTLLALARHCMNDVRVSLEFIDKVSNGDNDGPFYRGEGRDLRPKLIRVVDCRLEALDRRQ